MTITDAAEFTTRKGPYNMTNIQHHGKIQKKRLWKSLRTHIMSRREKNKQVEAVAETMRKKKLVEHQKSQENKLSLAQINCRLTELQDKRHELEEEKRLLLKQTQTTDIDILTEPIWYILFKIIINKKRIKKTSMNRLSKNVSFMTNNNTNNIKCRYLQFDDQ